MRRCRTALQMPTQRGRIGSICAAPAPVRLGATCTSRLTNGGRSSPERHHCRSFVKQEARHGSGCGNGSSCWIGRGSWSTRSNRPECAQVNARNDIFRTCPLATARIARVRIHGAQGIHTTTAIPVPAMQVRSLAKVCCCCATRPPGCPADFDLSHCVCTVPAGDLQHPDRFKAPRARNVRTQYKGLAALQGGNGHAP